MTDRGSRDETLTVSPEKVLALMAMVIGVLLALHIVVMRIAYGGEDRLTPDDERYFFFDVDYEVSLPTWWQQSILLGIGLLALVIAHRKATLGAGDVRHWRALAAVFALMSIDEGTEVHGRFTDPVSDLLDIEGGVLAYAWIIPGIAVVVIFGVAFFRFWLRLPSVPRMWLAVAGVVYIAGAVGVEALGALREESHGKDYGWSLLTALEEGLEMVGQALGVYALLLILAHLGGWRASVLVGTPDEQDDEPDDASSGVAEPTRG